MPAMNSPEAPKKKRARPKSGIAMRFQAYCECGWNGSVWGAECRKSAWSDLKWHQANECKLEKSK